MGTIVDTSKSNYHTCCYQSCIKIEVIMASRLYSRLSSNVCSNKKIWYINNFNSKIYDFQSQDDTLVKELKLVEEFYSPIISADNGYDPFNHYNENKRSTKVRLSQPDNLTLRMFHTTASNDNYGMTEYDGRKARPKWESTSIVISTVAFLLYFAFLREENDWDEEMYDNEETQLEEGIENYEGKTGLRADFMRQQLEEARTVRAMRAMRAERRNTPSNNTNQT